MCDDDSINIKFHSNELHHKKRIFPNKKIHSTRFAMNFIKEIFRCVWLVDSRFESKGATAFCSLRSFMHVSLSFLQLVWLVYFSLVVSPISSTWSWDEHNATYKKSFCYLKHAWYAIRLFFIHFTAASTCHRHVSCESSFHTNFYSQRTTTTWVFFVRNFPAICSVP